MIIDANTSVYAVLGDPVSHTLSPVMHNRAFEYSGYKGVYLAFKVENIEKALASLRILRIKGASITIPHKTEAVKYLDETDDIASRIGAVNTIINDGGRLKGYNSDGTGAVKALSEKTAVKGKHIALIGAGGAARSLGFFLKKEGGKITVMNRSKDKGESLATDLSGDYRPLNDTSKTKYDIIINATSVWMTPNTDAAPI